jgi:hypothetical protein
VERVGAELEAIRRAAAPLALTAWTAVHGLAVVLLDGLLADKPGSGVPPEALARVVTDLVIGGLRRRTARA